MLQYAHYIARIFIGVSKRVNAKVAEISSHSFGMHHAVYGEMDVQLHAFLSWPNLDMSSQLHTTGRFSPGKITPNTLPS